MRMKRNKRKESRMSVPEVFSETLVFWFLIPRNFLKSVSASNVNFSLSY